VAEFMQESVVFLVRVQCRRKESSRSLSHLLMSFLLNSSVKSRLIFIIRIQYGYYVNILRIFVTKKF